MAQKLTQLEKILREMNKGKQVSRALATRLGVSNLSARITNLRDAGYTIYCNSRKVDGKAVTMYRLDEKNLPAADCARN